MRKIIFALLIGLFSLSVMGQADKTAPKWDLTRPNPKNETEMNSMTRMQEGSEVWRDDEKVYYRYVNGAWVPEPSGDGTGGASELLDLSDVSSATATNRFALMGNGTNFAARALVEADISDFGSYIETLSDLGITASATEINYTDGVTSNIQTQLDSKTDDQNASEVPFTPYSNITSTDTQSAIEELKDELDAGTGTDDQTASEVNITDSGGNYTGTTVEAALTEIADSLAVKSNIDPNSPIQTIAFALADTESELTSASLGENTIGFSKDGGSTLSLNSLTDVTKGSVATNSSGTLRVLADDDEDGEYNEIDWTPPSSGLTNIIEDTSPELGGNLLLNGFNVTGTGNLSINSGSNYYMYFNSTGLSITNPTIHASPSNGPFGFGTLNGDWAIYSATGVSSASSDKVIFPVVNNNVGSGGSLDVEVAEFLGKVAGQDPTEDDHFVTKGYADTNYSGSGASELSDLSDVNTSTPTNRNVLVADGTDWESRALVEADISDLGNYLESDVENTWTSIQHFNSGLTSGDEGITTGIDDSTSGQRWKIVKNVADGDLRFQYQISAGTDETGSFSNVYRMTTDGTAVDPSDILTVANISSVSEAVPDDTGSSNGDVLTTDGSGTYTWETIDFPAEIGLACSDEISDLSTGLKLTFRMPYAMTLTEIRASVGEAPTGSTIEIDVQESATTLFSTILTIDNGEETSETAATPAVLSDTSLADDAEITVIIDQVGSTTTGKGLKLWLIGTRSL